MIPQQFSKTKEVGESDDISTVSTTTTTSHESSTPQMFGYFAQREEKEEKASSMFLFGDIQGSLAILREALTGPGLY